jgi:hypothetical protein
MRLIIGAIAAALLTVPAVPAYSQQNGAIPKAPMQAPPKKEKDEKTPEQKKAEERAYKDAIGRIPDQKFDPWRSVR